VGAKTAIEWATHTFNPWTGCTRVSPGCDHCYAAEQAKRNPAVFGSWEPGGARKRTSAEYWKQPLRWNREAERTGTRLRVFCASMADVFDNQVEWAWRQDLWELISNTLHLDWLLLTKRPQNIAGMLPAPGVSLDAAMWPWPNVWLGTTVENQAEADRRIPHLLAVPAAKRFLSCEPLLGPVDLTYLAPQPGRTHHWSSLYRDPDTGRRMVNWVIAGGESGAGARPMHPDWARSLRDQCAAAGVPFFFKQWGEWAPGDAFDLCLDNPLMDRRGEVRDWMKRYVSNEEWGRRVQAHSFTGHSTNLVYRVGKKAAGRLLDGIEHNEVPSTAESERRAA
jgi:protein gp37